MLETPDPKALLEEARARQQAMDGQHENYTFHRVRRVEELNPRGTVTKSTVMEREVFFVNGRSRGWSNRTARR